MAGRDDQTSEKSEGDDRLFGRVRRGKLSRSRRLEGPLQGVSIEVGPLQGVSIEVGSAGAIRGLTTVVYVAGVPCRCCAARPCRRR